MSRRTLLTGLAAVALLGATAATVPRRGRDDAAIPVVVVARTHFASRVQAEGNLKEVASTQLAVPVDSEGGFKIAWLAPDGGTVRQGEVVVRFDPTDIEKRLQDGQSAHASSESKIAKAREQSRARLLNLDRDAALARRELEAARAPTAMDTTIFSRNQIVEAEIDSGLAATRETHARGTRQTRESLFQTEGDLLAIEQRKADLKVNEATKLLTSLELRAPHDGIVLIQRDRRGNQRRVGDSAWSGEVIARIPKLEKMEAEVFVLEADAGGLAVGREATVRIEAHPEVTYKARVKSADSLARPRVRGVPVQYFAVTLELERTDVATMKPGQRVQATLTLAERKDALVVPRQSVFDRSGKKLVYRRRDDGFEAVAVTLGETSPGRVVVDKGLVEGDELALRDPTLSRGDLLAPAPSPGDSKGGKKS